MNVCKRALPLLVAAGISGLGMLWLAPGTTRADAAAPWIAPAHGQASGQPPADWDQRVRHHRQAKARIQLNGSLSPQAKRLAVERLEQEQFTAEERCRLLRDLAPRTRQ